MNPVQSPLSFEPLRWPFDRDKLGDWQKVLMGMPFLGPDVRASKALRHQQRHRRPDCLAAWHGFTPVQIELARTISGIIHRQLEWPNDFFIPSDTFEVMTWHDDGLATVEVVIEIEERVGPRSEDEWQAWGKQSYGEVITALAP